MTINPPPLSTQPASAKPSGLPIIRSEEILRGQSAVPIEHAGQYYVLRVTRENKLILTK